MKAALFLIFLLTASFAHGGVLDDAEDIINASVPCNQLSNSQLEMLGDFYMEQIHPGTAHQLMDKMIGENSSRLRDMHVQMARNIYCGESRGMMGYGMMGGGAFGMMSGTGNVMNYIYVILVIGIIVLVYLGIYKLIKGDVNDKKEKK